MPNPPITDERLREIADVCKGRTSVDAAPILGISASTIRCHLRTAAQRGLMGFKPVLTGFEISRISTAADETGNITKTYVTQRPERNGEPFAVPAGHLVKGTSALLDADNRVIQQWVKTREGDNSSLLVEAIKSAFDSYKGRAELIPLLNNHEADLATAYVIGDHHLGLYAWGKETGADYDIKIGERVLIDAMNALVSNAPASETAIVLNLGDFFHADDSENRTARSGNALDVDTRYGLVLQVGIKLMVACVEMALQKHSKVIVRCLPGNHDPHTSLALSAALAAFFHVNERVTIDCDPSKFFWFQFGKVFIGATHGDMVKPDRMPGVMAAMKPESWGKTIYRYAYFGHVHHRSKFAGECDGVICETFQTLSAKDAWHHSMGFTSGRSMVAITHHRNKGEILRHTVSVNPRGHA